MAKRKQPKLVGQKIKTIREMTDVEMANEDWHGYQAGVMLVLEDGTKIFPSQDPEGNGPGCLFGINKDGSFYVTPTK
jgi:hypothetical protein